MIYEEEYKLQEKLLNKLDLRPYIKLWMNVGEIFEAIEDAYEDHIFPEEIDAIVEAPPFDGYILNLFSSDDLMDYLEKRYGTRFKEEFYYVVTKETDNG